MQWRASLLPRPGCSSDSSCRNCGITSSISCGSWPSPLFMISKTCSFRRARSAALFSFTHLLNISTRFTFPFLCLSRSFSLRWAHDTSVSLRRNLKLMVNYIRPATEVGWTRARRVFFSLRHAPPRVRHGTLKKETNRHRGPRCWVLSIGRTHIKGARTILTIPKGPGLSTGRLNN